MRPRCCWHRDSETGESPWACRRPRQYRGPAGARPPAGPRQGGRLPLPRRCRGDRGFGTRAGRAAGRARSLPRSPRRTGGSGVAPAGRATAGSPPGTTHGVAAGRAAASRSHCASSGVAGRGLPERRSSLGSMPEVRRTGCPAHCRATVAAATIAAAGRLGSRSRPRLPRVPRGPTEAPSP